MIRASNQIQFDLPEGRARRDEGIALVTANEPDFSQEFHDAIMALPSGWVGQCEDIRRAWTGTIPHHNAWGACWNAAIRRKLLVDTQQETSMTAVKSHGRKTHLYRKP